MPVPTSDFEPGYVIMSDRGGRFTIEVDTRTCTCGECLNGWLSPVRAFQLNEAAAIASDVGRDTLDDVDYTAFGSGQKRNGKFVDDDIRLIPLTTHIPASVKMEGISRTFMLGYYAIIRLVCNILDQGLCPTRQTIFDAIKTLKGEATRVSPMVDPVCKPAEIDEFLSTVHGWLAMRYGAGMETLASGVDDGVDFALYALIAYAEGMEEDEQGDLEEVAKLPKCKNGNETWLGVLERLSQT